MKKKNISLLVFLLFALLLGQSCKDDFLNRVPLDGTSDQTFFTKASDLKNYVNGMYSIVIRSINGNKWGSLADGSDDYVGSSPSGSLMKRDISGQAPETSSAWNNGYANARKVNYFLVNAHKLSPMGSDAKHYLGEGYFIRAFIYFNLVSEFGDVPYITEPLETDSEELYRARDPRDFVVSQIIADLDSAILNLQWKGQGAANEAGRINKQAALVLKTRVALYEGSWEKYHGAKNTPFAVKDKDGTNFLQAAVEAGDMLIDHENANIFVGRNGWEYNELWDMQDYSTVNGAYLYKVYSFSHSVTNDWYTYSTGGWGGSITKGCVDQYLAKDGKPVEISSLIIDETSMNSLAENKDPRLAQTVWHPAMGTFKDILPKVNNTHAYNTSMPGLITNQQRWPALTGLRIWKGTLAKTGVEANAGEFDDLIIRYGEGLLNFAEAKSLLGNITQEDINKTINVLRNRVQMTPMSLADVNSWNVTYKAEDGYDIAAPNIVNEIRRERRVELLLEGFRADDIKRWALMENVYNGLKPEGAYLQEFLNYWNNPAALEADGFVYSKPSAVVLTPGANCDAHEDGYINPFWKQADFKAGGSGYYIDPGRDYLNAIPSQEITIYSTKGGVTLEQNPGWF